MSSGSVYLCSGGPNADRKVMLDGFGMALKATGVAHPKVAYVGTASLDSRPFFISLAAMLKAAGASDVEMAPIVKKPDWEKAGKILENADAIFLTGGEVEDGIVWLKKAGLDTLLTRLYSEGKIFFGISAGCIMMGQHWVHWDKEGDDSTSSLFDCLDFVPFTFDAHGEEEDWTELKCALRLLGNGSIGYGLSDGGFFRADNAGNFYNISSTPTIYVNHNGKIKKEKKDGK